MINVTVVPPTDYIPMPWRNGAGTTIELIKRNYSDDVFAWRLSMADVVEDGLFSNFEHYDRTLLLLEGDGITLQYNGEKTDALSKPLEMAQFKGEDHTKATLHGGPIKDFNIMTRRGICHAKTTCGFGNSKSELLSTAATLLVFAVQGDVTVNSDAGDDVLVADQSLLVIEPAPIKKMRLSGAFIAVEIYRDAES